MYGGEDGEVHSLQDALEGDWMDTRFCAVMRITEGGTADGVYLLYTTSMPLTVERVVSRIKMGSIRRKMGSFGATLGRERSSFRVPELPTVFQT